MNADGCEPIVAQKVALGFAVGYVPSRHRIDVLLRKPKVNHVDRLVMRREADNAVAQLDVAVEDAPRMHELETRYLH